MGPVARDGAAPPPSDLLAQAVGTEFEGVFRRGTAGRGRSRGGAPVAGVGGPLPLGVVTG